MKVITALWERQIKRYYRSKFRVIGSIGQPLLFLVALGFGLGPVFSKAGEGNYMQFLAPGVMSMGILFTGIFLGAELIWDKQFGILKETLVAPVSRFEIMIGRTLGGATIAVMQAIIIFFLALIIGFKPSLLMIPLALVFAILIALLFTALGTIFASIVDDMQGFQLVMNFVTMPIFFLSGALFPIQGLPPVMITIMKVNPLAYGVDGLRGTLAGGSYFGLVTDFVVLVVITILLLILGSYLFSKIEV